MTDRGGRGPSIVEACTIIIAVTAVIVSIWQLLHQRRHDEISVQPLLVLRHEWDEEFYVRTVYIENLGLGPAFIDRATVIQPDGNETELNKTLFIDWNFNYPIVSLDDSLDVSMFYSTPPALLSGDGLTSGEVISPGEKIPYIRFHRVEKMEDSPFRLSVRSKSLAFDKKTIVENYFEVEPWDYEISPFGMLMNFFKKTTIHIEYRSMYNKKQEDINEPIYQEVDRDIV